MSEYVDASGEIAAHYEYSPFGETIVATGSNAKDFAHRFSTKYFCDEFGMGDWGRRWYSPSMARFISEDPIGEKGGLNLYGYAANRSIDGSDILGLIYKDWESCRATAIMMIEIASNSEIDSYAIDTTITVTLGFDECLCGCEKPKFRQKANACYGRKNDWTQDREGEYVHCTGWYDDPQGFYPTQSSFTSATMIDSPGPNWSMALLGFKIELFTCAVCTEGKCQGNLIGCRGWGMEVKSNLMGDIKKRSWGAGTFR